MHVSLFNHSRTTIVEMKAGKRDKAQFWTDLPIDAKQEKQKVLIKYYAFRDDKGRYLGVLECL